MVANQLTPSTLRWTTLSFASKIEGKKGIFPKPSLPLAVERVVERSNDRVSNYTRDITANARPEILYFSHDSAEVILKAFLRDVWLVEKTINKTRSVGTLGEIAD